MLYLEPGNQNSLPELLYTHLLSKDECIVSVGSSRIDLVIIQPTCDEILVLITDEPRYEKTCFLHMQK